MIPTELLWNEHALDDIARGSDASRLRVGDWRVRFIVRVEERSATLPATGTIQVRVVEVLRVRHRSVAYRDL